MNPGQIPDAPLVFERVITLPAVLDSLDRLLEWMEIILEDYSCSEKTGQQITMVSEEIFINITNYAYSRKNGEVTVRIGRTGKTVALQFEDGGIPFNPLEWPNPKTKGGIETRNIGGLGIYLIKTMTDHAAYQRLDGKNLLTIFKTPEKM
jgi:anti-sigma regulatory factor (Ser/Thr protein kinase)